MAAHRGPVRTLVKALGTAGAIRVVGSLTRRALTDRPFRHLPPPTDRRERLSRAQAEPAVLLYRTLLERLSRERALAITTEVIAAGAVDHLRRTLKGLDPTTFAALKPHEREAQVARWVDAFFTAEARIDGVTDREVRFTVERCALARLSHAAGHPELAPSFCVGDAHFFAQQTPPVMLERPETIAEGGSCCPFTLRMQAPSGDTNQD
jgi:hypothetical protein